MQFQNAVITPSGIAIFSAANTNKPIKFTRFLFTDSVTRLTGQETELPANTWGNGSVDAVLGQDELQQFVIFASASNAQDYGYARGYGIYAEQEGVEYLVAVANCLGDPTYVSQMSGGYTRFHLALTIKYSINSNVLTVEPNIGGLITREEFEMWTNRVVTTTSPSGAPYGEDQGIHGIKRFYDQVQVGTILNPTQMMLFCDNVGLMGSLIPMGHPSMPENLGTTALPFDEIHARSVYADYITGSGLMTIDGSILSGTHNDIELDITNTIFRHTDFQEYPSHGYLHLNIKTQQDSYNSQRRVTIQRLAEVSFYLDPDSRFLTPSTSVTITFSGKSKSGQLCSEVFKATIAAATVSDPAIPGQTFKMVKFPDWRPQNADREALAWVEYIHYIYLDLEITQ